MTRWTVLEASLLCWQEIFYFTLVSCVHPLDHFPVNHPSFLYSYCYLVFPVFYSHTFFSLLLKFCLALQFLYFVHIDKALWIHFLHFLFTVSQNPRAFQNSLYYGDFRITPLLLTDDQYKTTQQTLTDPQNLFQIPQRPTRGQTLRL